MGTWRKKARNILYREYYRLKREGRRGKIMRKYLNAVYGEYHTERAKYPYRVWLQELDTVMEIELQGVKQVYLRLDAVGEVANG